MSSILTALLLAAVGSATATNTSAAPYNPADYSASKGEDSPAGIAHDSARDLTDNHYYNKPGATRADYDKDWQECRLIARGSISPTGAPTVIVYNPAVISAGAAAAGGIIGSLIASAIQDGQQRRANRRSCLMIKGWSQVEVEPEQVARYAALPDAGREAMFNTALGDPNPQGKRIVRWSNQFAAPVLAEKQ